MAVKVGVGALRLIPTCTGITLVGPSAAEEEFPPSTMP